MTKGMVKMTNILLQCACMLAPSGYNIHFIMCHWLGKILIFMYLSYSIMYHLVGGYSGAKIFILVLLDKQRNMSSR